jgi:hypothetical protein
MSDKIAVIWLNGAWSARLPSLLLGSSRGALTHFPDESVAEQ